MTLISTYVLKHIPDAYRFVYLSKSYAFSPLNHALALEAMDTSEYGYNAIESGRWVSI
jgi:hypothetical protein